MHTTNSAYGLITAEIDLCNWPITPGANKGFLLSPESIEKATACINEGFAHQLKDAVNGGLAKLSGQGLTPAERPLNPTRNNPRY